MKIRRISLFFLSMCILFALSAGTVFAEPAPALDAYEFDGIRYINIGSGNFSENPYDYYYSMLTNSIGINGADTGTLSEYSFANMWTQAGFDMLRSVERSDRLTCNFFKTFSTLILDDEAFRKMYAKPGGLDSYKVEIKGMEFNNTCGMKMGDVVAFYGEPFGSASNGKAMEEKAAYAAATAYNSSMSWIPALEYVHRESETKLEGPIFYSHFGIAGERLENYNLHEDLRGKDFHSMIVAFNNFSIVPIIPDLDASGENTYETKNYTDGSGEKKTIISDVKNESGEVVNASQTLSESLSTTISSSISGSSSHSNAYGVKIGAKLTVFKDLFEVSPEVSATITDTVTDGWSKSEGKTVTTSKSNTISVSLPAYTTILMEQSSVSQKVSKSYNCPVALCFDVHIYYMYGAVEDSEIHVYFDELTSFGNEDQSAREELKERMDNGVGAYEMKDRSGIRWGLVNMYDSELFDKICKTVPFDVTSASFTEEIQTVKNDVSGIYPIYPIDTIRVVNPNSVLTAKPWLYSMNMNEGDSEILASLDMQALNKFGAPFYTFYMQLGHYIVLDAEGREDTSGSVLALAKDPVSGKQTVVAKGAGTAYLKYVIDEDAYQTAYMVANTPDVFLTNEDINSGGSGTAVLRVNVTGKHAHTWLKPKYTWSEDYSTCTARRVCKYDSSHVEEETSDTEMTVESVKTCTEDGRILYTATFENEAFAPQTKIVTDKASGHTWGSSAVTREATASRSGILTRTCTGCGETEKITLPRLSDIYAKLLAKKSTRIVFSWKQVPDADGYRVYAAAGRGTGTYGDCKLLKTIADNDSEVYEITKKGLKTSAIYRGYVEAYQVISGQEVVIARSLLMYAITGNSTAKYSNAKKITVSNNKITVSSGRTYSLSKLSPVLTLYNKARTSLPVTYAKKYRYTSSDTGIAAVSAAGVVTGVSEGVCRVYIIAANGVRRAVQVMVK